MDATRLHKYSVMKNPVSVPANAEATMHMAPHIGIV
jgi:hypothetical protein